MRRRFGSGALLLLLLVGLAAGARAQVSTTGSIGGTVRDPQGAAVPKAEVTIAEESTGASRTVTANDEGFYLATGLPVGRYTVTTSPSGFKKTVSTGVELHVGEKLNLDLNLEVGGVGEVVTVTGEAQQVETRSANVSSLVSSTQVRELPLNGRNYAQLALMVPGVSPVTQSGAGGAFRTGGTGLDSGVDMSVNGNGSNQNMWTVDGVNNMDVGSNRTLLVFPSIDSIQEFRVERNSFSAEYGQAQGAVINLVTKGGGNNFHGTLFEFFRNDALNANDFFLNRAGQEKGPLRYNNFGGNFSGPVYLPRFGEGGPSVWSGKNRAFFFWSEEWRRERRGQVLTGRVPTAAEKLGNFSGALTGPVPVDPATCHTVPDPAPDDPNRTRLVCDPFAGNIIPANRLSPVGLALVQLFPNPNTPNPTAGQNWAAAPMQPVDTRQDNIRFDVNVTDKMNVMVKYINETWTHGVASGNFWGDSPFPTLSSDWDQPSHSFAVKVSNTLSSTAVNDFQFSRAGNDIFIQTSQQSQALVDRITSIFPTVFPSNRGVVPSLFWGPGGYNDLWHQAPWENHQDLNIWKDDFSKVMGSHELKLGALYSRNRK
ncbi:MAG TPA: carboxypeptidase regulatory-like domain-containing protein, partial [Pyrinomonadaceae bacterium]